MTKSPLEKKPKKSLDPRRVDLLWQIGKAVLCVLQYAVLIYLSTYSLNTVVYYTYEQFPSPLFHILYLGVAVGFYWWLWTYCDKIDDRSFDRFCEAEEPPVLLREKPWRIALVISVLGATPGMAIAFTECLLRFIPALSVWALPIGLILSLGITTGLGILRVRALSSRWRVQKDLRRPNDKKVKPVVRVLYAVIYFGGLCLAVLSCIYWMPVAVAFGMSAVELFREFPLLLFIPLVITVGSLIWGFWKYVWGRVRFMKRLRRLREKGELSYTVHGHPYLSLFHPRAEFALTITDYPHPESRVKTPTTYRVAVANCRIRRMYVILCEDNIYQFMYTLQFRVRNMRSMSVMATGQQVLTIPLASWFTTHHFDFPEGDGRPILLVDPAPYNLCMRGTREGELLPLDNASEIYGYTVFGKNSFLNMLERM